MNQTQIFGIIRHALTFGAGFIAAKGWINAGDVPQIVSAAMTLAGVLWSIHEKIEVLPPKPAPAAASSAIIPPPDPTATLSLIAVGLLCLGLCSSGCSTLDAGGNTTASPAEQVVVVSQIVQDGTQLGVVAALTQKPELRQYFEASREALNAALGQGLTSPTQLQAYLNQSVPAPYQPLVNVALNAGINAYTAWYAANAPKLTSSDTAKYALQILTALDAGLNAALGPPPVPVITTLPTS
jgi:hypothetical protein